MNLFLQFLHFQERHIPVRSRQDFVQLPCVSQLQGQLLEYQDSSSSEIPLDSNNIDFE